jgi:cyclase
MTLCRRVVILLCLCDGVLFRTKRFVPDYRYTTKLVGNRNADEVVVIDVTPVERRQANRRLFYDALQRYAAECFSPITVGGGVRTLDEVRFLIGERSADKVVIGANTLAADKRLGFDIVEKFGVQALVCAVNHRDGEVTAMPTRGVGEILLNSIDRDGSLMGYDLCRLESALRRAPGIPVMVAGGCGTWKHMADAFEAGADAACTSVIHHLTETSLAACKAWLAANCKQPVRAAA